MKDFELTEAGIQKLLSRYLKEKNKDAVSVLKMIKTRISTEKGRLKNVDELAGDDILTLVKKEIKEIRETIESLLKAGSEEKIREEENKIEVLQGFVPAQLSEEEIQKIIDTSVEEVGRDNFGKVMKTVMGKAAGKADGKLVSDLVRKTLAE